MGLATLTSFKSRKILQNSEYNLSIHNDVCIHKFWCSKIERGKFLIVNELHTWLGNEWLNIHVDIFQQRRQRLWAKFRLAAWKGCVILFSIVPIWWNEISKQKLHFSQIFRKINNNLNLRKNSKRWKNLTCPYFLTKSRISKQKIFLAGQVKE